jgi:hypothetical protein
LNETTSGQLNAPLLHLALEEGVGEQGDPIEKEQGRDAFVLVEVEGRYLQIALAETKAFFNAILMTERSTPLFCKATATMSPQMAFRWGYSASSVRPSRSSLNLLAGIPKTLTNTV